MHFVFGMVVLALGLLAWGGQTVVWLAPAAGRRWGLVEAEEDVEPTFWADIRGEAPWDAFTLWTAVVAGLLLILGNNAWPYFGLAGGAIYVYFGGRGIFTRMAMRRRGLRVGREQSVRIGLAFLGIWAVMGVVLAVASIVKLA